jgi:hypothetical protein
LAEILLRGTPATGMRLLLFCIFILLSLSLFIFSFSCFFHFVAESHSTRLLISSSLLPLCNNPCLLPSIGTWLTSRRLYRNWPISHCSSQAQSWTGMLADGNVFVLDCKLLCFPLCWLVSFRFGSFFWTRECVSFVFPFLCYLSFQFVFFLDSLLGSIRGCNQSTKRWGSGSMHSAWERDTMITVGLVDVMCCFFFLFFV